MKLAEFRIMRKGLGDGDKYPVKWQPFRVKVMLVAISFSALCFFGVLFFLLISGGVIK